MQELPESWVTIAPFSLALHQGLKPVFPLASFLSVGLSQPFYVLHYGSIFPNIFIIDPPADSNSLLLFDFSSALFLIYE
jgi:hypothetical protein